jgi:hypothetical protein
MKPVVFIITAIFFISVLPGTVKAGEGMQGKFFSPNKPVYTHYTVDCKINDETIRDKILIRVKNTSGKRCLIWLSHGILMKKTISPFTWKEKNCYPCKNTKPTGTNR